VKLSVLIVDDEILIRKSLSKVLRARGFAVESASTGAEGLEKAAADRPQVMILDMRLPDGDGLSVLRQARGLDPLLQVIVITAYGDVQSAVEAMKLGACDFLRKPYEMEDIVLAVDSAGRNFRQATELDLYRRQAWRNYSGEEIIGDSAPMGAVLDLIEKVVRSKATSVLITGESGTGKELVARAIHQRSTRASQPFVAVNVAAIPESLVESELFGHEKGAFTGAHARKLGRFELAHGGTIFLDEIGSLRLDLQVKLLRALQEREVERLGGVRSQPVDVRVVAATNVNLLQAVRARAFREDLYYRLNVVPIHVLPLRERRADIPFLVEHFVRKVARECRRQVDGVSAGALEALMRYDWPGNVRELENVIHRAVVLAAGPVVMLRDVPLDVAMPETGAKLTEDTGLSLRDACEQFERQYVLRVLERVQWNVSRAARLLGVHRNTILTKLSAWGIHRPA
jgi:DNA-binding NtrC family response regulator